MAAEEKDATALERPSSAFDLLFERNLNHVLEMIFFPLDNASFKNCLEVCPEWREFLTSEKFQKRRSDFSQRLWMDTENLKHQVHTTFDYVLKQGRIIILHVKTSFIFIFMC